MGIMAIRNDEREVLALPATLGEQVFLVVHGEIKPATIVGWYITLHTPSVPLWCNIKYQTEKCDREIPVAWEEAFGKSVFWTSSEAEKVL